MRIFTRKQRITTTPHYVSKIYIRDVDNFMYKFTSKLAKNYEAHMFERHRRSIIFHPEAAGRNTRISKKGEI